MRPTILIGSAVTSALLALVAAVVGGIVAGNQVSVTPGVITRTVLVVVALAVTAAIWGSRMGPTDRAESLVAGLSLGWFLDLANWDGHGVIGQLFTSSDLAAAMIDLIVWSAVSLGLVALLARRPQAPANPIRSGQRY
ncbi:hypothetical protein C6I20_13090 [Aeromicrobium sp. A1-2]|uniref:hypothetical protein n=1 Tax=Aeromicrobium sp. A1-2 TaxID=2107713 RepID=UPI000E511E82|nr:hypothetical protein [Aeromicrobium sp. A1-2]AXT86028.1 hypothetical protein C6I20_13090 [Aeromicrobium sp. A1-2]